MTLLRNLFNQTAYYGEASEVWAQQRKKTCPPMFTMSFSRFLYIATSEEMYFFRLHMDFALLSFSSVQLVGLRTRSLLLHNTERLTVYLDNSEHINSPK